MLRIPTAALLISGFLCAVFVCSVFVPSANAGQFVAQEEDFVCVTDWTLVGNLRVHNPGPRRLKRAIRLIENDRPRRHLPKGTIVQLIPQEAMVKRGRRFNPKFNGWEFFRINDTAAGTEIVQRGREEVVNGFTGESCQSCHAAAKRHDFVCANDHGCVPLPPFVTDEFIALIQAADKRCAP